MLKTVALHDKRSRLKKPPIKSQTKKLEAKNELFSKQLVKSWGQFYKVGGEVLSPISTEAEYLARLELVDTLWDKAKDEDDPRMALVRLLLSTIAEWEKVHEVPYVEGVAGHIVLKSLMDEHHVTQRQLEEEGIMQQSLASKILLGKRGISKALAKRLAKRFHVNPAVFI